MPLSRYISVYLATAAGWAPSQERKRRSGRVLGAESDWCVFWEDRGVLESKGEEEVSAAG